MTRDNRKNRDGLSDEDRGLLALAAMAIRWERSKQWTQEDLDKLMDRADSAGLTDNEINGTGLFSFENIKKVIFGSDDEKSSDDATAAEEMTREELAAVCRGESELSDKAKEELRRQRESVIKEHEEEQEETNDDTKREKN